MAPGRPRRVQAAQPPSQSTQNDHQENQESSSILFIDPMMGTPLPIYVDNDVEDRENIVRLILSHGGTISQSYTGVPYILVDPHKPSGQNLYRHHISKKGKIVLDARWVYECIRLNQLQTFHTNYAGYKVTGKEPVQETPGQQPQTQPLSSVSAQVIHPQASSSTQEPSLHNRLPSSPEVSSVQASHNNLQNIPRPNGLPQPDRIPGQHPPMQPLQGHRPGVPPVPPGMHPSPMPVTTVDPLNFSSYASLFNQDMNGAPTTSGAQQPPGPTTDPSPPPRIQTENNPPQTWQATAGIAPSQTHLHPTQEHMMQRAHVAWAGYPYDYRYRGDGGHWVQYYDPGYAQAYHQYASDPGAVASTSNSIDSPMQLQQGAGPSNAPQQDIGEERQRGRKRTRTQPPTASASSLVVNRGGPARSPTPPSRVIKSTYGGNLFTADDVIYLRKYIDYCRDQGLVLSLREICERIAIRAPHHTFYSWRRYCNKHQIRLGGYLMNNNETNRSESTEGDWDMEASDQDPMQSGPTPTAPVLGESSAQQAKAPRNRSPTPPRALFRSTTGKGVAFTVEDRDFLINFMDYRKSQGRLDMVQFWKDVAAKAPHHSRASWMKYWRRHKHEFNRTESDAPLPPAPEKKMRYSRQDDVLLAKYFAGRPTGTSDAIFQEFGRIHPHHPWKGWQEHHRIHKAKIDNLIAMLQRGENIDNE